ncbi:MAG: cytochrome b [Pseudomonadota bacterium]|nr:RNA methyltransferase [Pseudomonadales bacterium]MDY6920864.1 cytochrome b [Pseudomonadota bacterium]
MHQDSTRLSRPTVVMHWIVALTVLGLLAVGFIMHEFKLYSLYGLHKSTGIAIFVVIVLRVLWRIKEGWPAPASRYQRYEQLLSRAVHYVLLIATVLMPFSGILMSLGAGAGLPFYGLDIVARNPDPANPGKLIPLSEPMAKAGAWLHGLLAWVLVVAITLHVAGALKHHLVDKDGTLRRMLGARIEPAGE